MSDDDIRFVCVARLDGRERVFLWESGDNVPDSVVVDDDGFVVMFASQKEARSLPGVSAESAVVYDLDSIGAWCRSDSDVAEHMPLLNAWNLFVDLPHDANLFAAADARTRGIYDKLFHGCNLPVMTAPGEHYVPHWTAAETAELKRVLLLGLAEFRARLR
ncbi:MAG: hypothetical protein HOV81_23695 [Kofleriaceae bacterium]|nr:hypothetical protein [Kofleriaceae bacterium]